MNTLKYTYIFFPILFIIGCYHNKQITIIDLTELTISDIHMAYQEGRYNSQQLVSTYTVRIEQYNSKVNAITIINPKALSIAKALGEEFK